MVDVGDDGDITAERIRNGHLPSIPAHAGSGFQVRGSGFGLEVRVARFATQRVSRRVRISRARMENSRSSTRRAANARAGSGRDKLKLATAALNHAAARM